METSAMEMLIPLQAMTKVYVTPCYGFTKEVQNLISDGRNNNEADNRV